MTTRQRYKAGDPVAELSTLTTRRLDFTKLYGASSASSKHHLTANMALKLYSYGCALMKVVQNRPEVFFNERILPASALKQQQTSKKWAPSFLSCFNRLLARLANGNGVSPNCTGEEMALRILLAFTRNAVASKLELGSEYQRANRECGGHKDFDTDLTKLGNKTCGQHITQGGNAYDGVWFDNNDVLELFGPFAADYLDPCSADTMGTVWLNPAEWFYMFDPAVAGNHKMNNKPAPPTQRQTEVLDQVFGASSLWPRAYSGRTYGSNQNQYSPVSDDELPGTLPVHPPTMKSTAVAHLLKVSKLKKKQQYKSTVPSFATPGTATPNDSLLDEVVVIMSKISFRPEDNKEPSRNSEELSNLTMDTFGDAEQDDESEEFHAMMKKDAMSNEEFALEVEQELVQIKPSSVHKVLDFKRNSDNELLYLVKWNKVVGSADSWEPGNTLKNCGAKIDAFLEGRKAAAAKVDAKLAAKEAKQEERQKKAELIEQEKLAKAKLRQQLRQEKALAEEKAREAKKGEKLLASHERQMRAEKEKRFKDLNRLDRTREREEAKKVGEVIKHGQQLERSRMKHDRQINMIDERHAALDKKLEKALDALATKEMEQADKLERQRQRHEEILAKRLQKHTDQLQDAERRHEQKLVKEEEKHKSALKTTVNKFKRSWSVDERRNKQKLAKLSKAHKSKLKKQEVDQKRKQGDLKGKLVKKIKSMKKKAAKKIRDIKNNTAKQKKKAAKRAGKKPANRKRKWIHRTSCTNKRRRS